MKIQKHSTHEQNMPYSVTPHLPPSHVFACLLYFHPNSFIFFSTSPKTLKKFKTTEHKPLIRQSLLDLLTKLKHNVCAVFVVWEGIHSCLFILYFTNVLEFCRHSCLKSTKYILGECLGFKPTYFVGLKHALGLKSVWLLGLFFPGYLDFSVFGIQNTTCKPTLVICYLKMQILLNLL